MVKRYTADLDARWKKRHKAYLKRIAVKERAVAHKGGRCSICGYDRCPAALVFHYDDPEEKDFNISETLSWPRIVAELDKCTLLCLNCHAEVHAGWHPQPSQAQEHVALLQHRAEARHQQDDERGLDY